jgi:hypothetical protein
MASVQIQAKEVGPDQVPAVGAGHGQASVNPAALQSSYVTLIATEAQMRQRQTGERWFLQLPVPKYLRERFGATIELVVQEFLVRP